MLAAEPSWEDFSGNKDFCCSGAEVAGIAEDIDLGASEGFDPVEPKTLLVPVLLFPKILADVFPEAVG
jgi:hypothetical protein